jgi:hypothetical protein
MTLSALIKKGGLTGSMTATLATPATQEANKPVTVAPVATVAVADNPKSPIKLSPDDEENIRAWLTYIKETDPEIIIEVVDKCRNDPDARRYFLKRSEEVQEPVTVAHPMTCGDCIHFEQIDHPHLGHCAKGEPEAIDGVCDTDRRYCERFFQGQSKLKATNKGPQGPNQKGEFPK